jgi:CheY-like chemotaxis protein
MQQSERAYYIVLTQYDVFFNVQPLTSMVSGVECIQEAMLSIKKEVMSTEQSAERTLEHVEAVRACLKSMLGTTSFMTMCINRCLDYTKASKGVKLVPKPETVRLQEALDFPISIMRDVQTQLPITLAPVPAEICSHIITDKQWLMENVLCLLSNAVRYSQAGSVEVRVLHQIASLDAEDGVEAILCIEVWDTGIGLPENLMSTLFTPFKQAQRLAGGTGLGLFSLAKRVEALHGQYGVCGRPDGAQGSMFWFSIPYRPDALSAAAAVQEAETTQHLYIETGSSDMPNYGTPLSPTFRRPYRVLVVEDAPSILKMTSMLLTKKGHNVEKAVNGAQAVDILLTQNGGYDVVLMDLQMPIMDGAEAIRRIRKAERDPETGGEMRSHQASRRRQLIIALSANSDSDTMQEALDAGADYFMSKPFTYETFRELMSKFA